MTEAVLAAGAARVGGWRIELRFQASPDEVADWSWFSPSLPWLRELSSGERTLLCEALRREGLAWLTCAGPEETARRLSQVRGPRVSARAFEPEGTEFRPAGQEAERTRGVYATPPALTRFVVRCVDKLLRSHLGHEEGLAHSGVRLLDPAAGPANFVLEAYRRALAQDRRAHGRRGSETLLREHLIPNFQGLEILPGPWSEGQSRLRRFVEQRGLSACPPRFPLFLADALAPLDEGRPRDGFLGGEARAASRVRGDSSVSVVVGNPPFRGRSANTGGWITALLGGYELPDGRTNEGYFTVDGRPLGETNMKWLQDDYVKFLRLAEWMIDRNGQGVVGFVVNHNCLEAPTFRGLRRSLLRTFDQVFALDLHGNQRRRETGPAGERDENLFAGVAQGIAVLLLVKGGVASKAVYRADLYGTRETKLRALAGSGLRSLAWTKSEPRAPLFLFRSSDAERDREFQRGVSLAEMFPVHSLGVVTGKDASVLAFQREDFEPRLAQAGRASGRRSVTSFLVRPFDLRQLLYERGTIERPRTSVMSHLRGRGNLGLLALRQSHGTAGVFVTRWVTGHKVIDSYSPNTVFPLFLYDEEDRGVPNLDHGIREKFAGTLGGDLPAPADLFGYVYAVLHDPRYLARFREPLRTGFPRIPLPQTREEFERRASLGTELAGLHLLDDPRIAASAVQLDGDRSTPLQVDPRALQYDESAGRLRLNRQGLAFEGIAPEVWHHQVGSYQVLDRWLRARAGQPLSVQAIREFRWIANAVRLSAEVQDRIKTL